MQAWWVGLSLGRQALCQAMPISWQPSVALVLMGMEQLPVAGWGHGKPGAVSLPALSVPKPLPLTHPESKKGSCLHNPLLLHPLLRPGAARGDWSCAMGDSC